MTMPDTCDHPFVLRHDGELDESRFQQYAAELRTKAAEGSCPESLFKIFVELGRNLQAHGTGTGILEIRQEPVGQWCICTRNAIHKEAWDAMEKRIQIINAYADTLPQKIRALRKAELPAGATSAGLGLMEVRRLSGSPIRISKDADLNGNSVLVMEVTVIDKARE